MSNPEFEEFVQENSDYLLHNIEKMLAFYANVSDYGLTINDLDLGGVEEDFLTPADRRQEHIPLTAEDMQPDIAAALSDATFRMPEEVPGTDNENARPPLSHFDLAEYLNNLDDHWEAEQAETNQSDESDS